MKIDKFEDLDCWKKARELTGLIYELTGQGAFRRDFGLKDQIQRAAVSVMSNIAEGFETMSDKGFIKYLSYSIASATEIQSQLYVALDQNYISNDEFNIDYALAEKTKALCKGLIKYLKT
ncbi:four helix bundle protein [Candidatus Margulisiibacteriota bacterium]